jgi:hypothetical protein
MADKKGSNSAEFNAMLSALREVAEMNASLSSPKLIEGNINRLKEASKDYMERIDGSIFRGVRADGKARRDMAGSLSDLADTWNESLTKAADGKIGEYWPLGQQASELETNRKAVESAANAYHLSQQQIAAARAAQAAPTPTVASQPAPQAETIVSKPAAQAETIVSPPTATAETVIQKPVSKAQTIERPAQGPNRERSRTINLATMMKEQKAAEEAAEPAKASKNSVREEILKRRSEIYEKRRQNEEAGIVNDGKNQAKKQAGKGGM